MPEQYTAKQLSDWRAYERVRQEGKFNMFDPRARIAAGLERDEFIFVMKNFSNLKAVCSPQQ